jgi:hypothetical protein
MAQPDQVLPSSDEAEEQVIGSCLLDGNETIARCLGASVTPNSFLRPENRLLYSTIIDLHQSSPPVSLETLVEELRGRLLLEDAGGIPHLMAITRKTPTTTHAGYFIQKLREKEDLRTIIMVAARTLEAATNPTAGRTEIDKLKADISATLNAGEPTGCEQGYTVWTPAQFEAHVPPADDALLFEGKEVYVRDGDTVLLLGAGGVGKSRLSRHLAEAQILGEDFVGFSTSGPPRRWLLVGNENSATRFKHELALRRSALTDSQWGLLNKHLLIQALVGEGDASLALDDPHALKRWNATAKAIKPEVLGLDPWESVILGGDCNDAAATRESVRILRSIFTPYNPRFTLLLVHHAREGAEAARKAEGFDSGSFGKGSKTLRAIARFVINVAPQDADDGGKVVLACGKANNSRKFVTRGAVLDEGTMTYALDHAFDLHAWRANVEGKKGGLSCSIADVVEAVKTGHHRTGDIVRAVKEATGACARTIKTRIAAACTAGYLSKCPPQGNYTLGRNKL